MHAFEFARRVPSGGSRPPLLRREPRSRARPCRRCVWDLNCISHKLMVLLYRCHSAWPVSLRRSRRQLHHATGVCVRDWVKIEDPSC